MPVLHLRSPLTVAAALLAAALLALWAAYDVETVVEVRRASSFTLPWGDGPRQVGRVEAGGRAFGPRSFAVAGDRVVVADTFNGRLLVVDRQGRPLDHLALRVAAGAGGEAAHAAGGPAGVVPAAGDAAAPWINDVAVGPDGRYYAADAAAPRVLVLDPDGSRVDVVDISPAAPREDPAGDAVFLLERIAVDEGGLLYLTHAYLSDALLARRVTQTDGAGSKFAQLSAASLREGGAVVDEEALLPAPANSFAVGLDGRLYVEAAGPSLFTRMVRSYDRDAAPVSSWEITRREPVITAEVVGASTDGWVYVALNPGRPQGRVLILTGGDGGDSRYEVDPGWSGGVEANVHARLAGDGLFTAAAGEAGWRLDHWLVERRVLLRPAWGR